MSFNGSAPISSSRSISSTASRSGRFCSSKLMEVSSSTSGMSSYSSSLASDNDSSSSVASDKCCRSMSTSRSRFMSWWNGDSGGGDNGDEKRSRSSPPFAFRLFDPRLASVPSRRLGFCGTEIAQRSPRSPRVPPFLHPHQFPLFPPTNSFLLFLPSNPPPFHLYIFFLDSIIELHFYQQNRYALFQRIKRKKKKHCQYQLNNSRTTEDTLTHISRAPPPCFRSTPPSLPVTFDE